MGLIGGALPLFTELPRRDVPGNPVSGIGESRKHSGTKGTKKRGPKPNKRERARPSPSKEGKMGGVWPIFLSIFSPTQ